MTLVSDSLPSVWRSKHSLPCNGRRLRPLADSPSLLQDFMTTVSLQCKIKNHHPEWSNVSVHGISTRMLSRAGGLYIPPVDLAQVYNTTFVRWTTHDPKGLSAKDVDMAEVCDSVAKDFGEIEGAVDAGAACEMQSLANTAASASGDCCAPRKPSQA